MTRVSIVIDDALDERDAVRLRVRTTALPPKVGAPLSPAQALALDAITALRKHGAEIIWGAESPAGATQ